MRVEGCGWPARTVRHWVPAVLFLAFLVAEKASFQGSGEPRRFNDTNVYMASAAEPLLSRDVLLGPKPMATSLLYKLAGRDGTRIAAAQSLLSVVCWSCLALAVTGEVRSRVTKVAAAVAIGLFSLSVPVNQWDWVLLSESLSFSLLVLTAAASLVLTRGLVDDGRWLTRWHLPWAVACLALALTRDSNVYLLAVLWGAGALGLAVDALRRVARHAPARFYRGLLLALLLLAPIIAASHSAARASLRWRDPLTNVVLGRVLTHPGVHREWVARYGLPRNPVFERYAGKYAWSRSPVGPPIRERFWEHDPEVEDVGVWLRERGTKSYVRYLVWDHPWTSLQTGHQAFAGHVNSAYAQRQYGRGAGKTPWTVALTRWTYPPIHRPGTLTAALLVVGIAAAILVPAHRRLTMAALFLVAIAWTQAFVTFHGDTSNVDRHMQICGMSLRLGVLLLGIVALDLIVTALGPESRRSPSSTTARR